MFRLFTAERAGMLAVVAVILFIAAFTLCDRAAVDAPITAPDSTLVWSIDSELPSVDTSTDYRRTSKDTAAASNNQPPYTRDYLMEPVIEVRDCERR